MRCNVFAIAAVLIIGAVAQSADSRAQNTPSQTPPVAGGSVVEQTPADLTKPYKPVAITPPTQVSDPALAALRKKIADAVKRRDKAQLAKLVVAKGFFWDREGADAADKRKSGIENLSAAVTLDGKDAVGWDMLAGYAQDPTGSTTPDHPNTICTPGDPSFDPKAMQSLLEATGSDLAEWGYPTSNNVDVRDKADAKTAPRQKLGMNFVRVAPDAASEPSPGSFLRIVTPDGKFGYVTIDDIAPLGNDQLCYGKEGGDWKITGYVGVGSDVMR
jgi:hypothetical protein